MRQITKQGMSLGDMYPAALAIMFIGILLGVGIFILASLHSSVEADYAGTQGLVNTSTGTTTLTNAALTNFNLSSVTTVTFNNGTTASTNYTSTDAGVFTWGADMVAEQGETLNVTYVYTYDAANSPEEAITSTISGVGDFADWIAIIVVTIAAAIVLGVVLGSFGRRRAMI